MMKRLWIWIAAAVVVVAGGAAWGYRLYSESQYYKLVQAQESAARAYFDVREASGMDGEQLSVKLNAASASGVKPAEAKADLMSAQTEVNTLKTAATSTGPAKLKAWEQKISETNKRLKNLWVSAKQRKALTAMNAQDLVIIGEERQGMYDLVAVIPAVTQIIGVTNSALALSGFSSYSTAAEYQAHMSELAPLKPYSAPGYTYPGEASVKAKYPQLDALVVSFDSTMGDLYVFAQDVANNDMLAALSLYPKIVNAGTRLENIGNSLSSYSEKYSKPLDNKQNAATEAIQQLVRSDSDARFRKSVGLRKYEAMEIQNALELYGFDHLDKNKNNVYPTGDYAAMMQSLKAGKYVGSQVGSGQTFTYTATNKNQDYTLSYTDDLTNKHENTGG